MKTIGLLGGSFNPAHAGHLYISQQALKLLGLKEVWWLVSPQNPLKSKRDMAPFEQRLAAAKKLAAKEPSITVSDFEAQRDLQYTTDTLAQLKICYPDRHFVWLMGADNLAEFHRWQDWEKIAHTLPLAIFNREGFKEAALTSPAAKALVTSRIEENKAKTLATMHAPAWVFLDIKTHPASATALRKKKAK